MQLASVTMDHLLTTNTGFNCTFWPEKLILSGANILLTGFSRTMLLNERVIDALPDSLTWTAISVSTHCSPLKWTDL